MKAPCSRIRELLLEYVTRETGPELTWLVREHLRTCPECRAEAARISRTIAALRGVPAAPAPESLRPSARRRIARAIAHPAMDWICEHHRFVAWLAALAAFAATMAVAWHFRFRPESSVYWVKPQSAAEAAQGQGAQ